jgi:hypothetical protein
MKQILSLLMAVLFLSAATGCEDPNKDTACGGLPHNAPPAELTGGWANGYASFTQIIDAYNGNVLGNTWQSGKYFRFTPGGQDAEFYFMAQSQYSKTATRVSGTISFDEGSTADNGSFVFHACSAHYRGWGSVTVDRDATEEELQNNLTRRYYYKMEGQWLRIEPGSQPGPYTSSFEKVE